MSTSLPDGAPLPGTRAALLAVQAERLSELGSGAFAVRRLLVGAGWVLLGLIGSGVLYAGLRQEGTGRIIGGALAVVLLGAAAGGLLRLARHGTRRRADLAAWSTVDRTLSARRLPPGDLPAEDGTLFDLRDRAEFAKLAPRVAARRQGGSNSSPVLATSLVAGLLLGLGLLPMAGLVAADTTAAGRLACAVALTLLWLVALSLLVGAVRENQLRSAGGRHAGTELDAYRLRRLLVQGEEPPRVHGSGPGVGLGMGLGSGLLALLLVGYLVVRLVTASTLAVVLTGVITLLLLVGIALGVVIAWRLAARTHVVPLCTPGTEPATALTTPTRSVSLDWTGGGLRITPARDDLAPVELRTDDVLGVHAMNSPGWWTEGVTVVTTDDVVVLAGAGIQQHPAILALTRSVGSRTTAG